MKIIEVNLNKIKLKIHLLKEKETKEPPEKPENPLEASIRNKTQITSVGCFLVPLKNSQKLTKEQVKRPPTAA